ncbi:hypothetical protein BDF19DRAFT_211325 [Syncephalis fuscata]|nr:hypothetical protein BDF19DRAFT_211325 [Syncephalis fuscata]
MEKRPDYQWRALTRSTLSYQKRQKFANICCIALCPLLMVAIAGILGIVVTNLLKKSMGTTETVYCANATGLVPGTTIPRATLDKVSLVSTPSFFFSSGMDYSKTTDSDFSYSYYACINWFEHDYPSSAPYELYNNSGLIPRRDTTFLPDPSGGWLNSNNSTNAYRLDRAQQFPWAIVRDASGVNSGVKNKQPVLNSLSQALSAINGTAGDSGLLGAIDTNLFVDINLPNSTNPQPSVNGMQPVPFFDKTNAKSDVDMDNLLIDKIQSITGRIAALREYKSSDVRVDSYFQIRKALLDMPWGAITFDSVNAANKQWKYTMQVGSDKRLISTGYMPSSGLRKIALQAMLGNAMARTAGNNRNDITITHGLRMYPVLQRATADIPIASYVGRILFPFGISFLLPIFVITLVKEKEDRILIMMRINGLKARNYYFVRFLQFFIMQFIATIIFVLTGVGFSMPFFTRTNPGIYIILLIIWTVVLTLMSFFLSCLFSKSQTSLISVFVLVLTGVIINTVVEQLVPGNISLAYFIWPPFAFYRALSLINMASIGSNNQVPYEWSTLSENNQVLEAMLFLIGEIVVLILLTAYLNLVVPSEYGVNKPWYFIFTEPFKWLRNKMNPPKNKAILEDGSTTQITRNGDDDEDYLEYVEEDDDVRAERDRVLNNRHPAASPLVTKHIRKVYGNGKVAVKDVTLAIEPNLVFGLLGPNGAGKTSLIHMLTGLYPPTSGEAWLNGYNIATQMKDVYQTMGICPQHDILWDDLSVEEHLYFYARLKGVHPTEEKAAVDKAIENVALQDFRERLSKGLSGGEKRRLSIAISLIGSSGVVFMDEPTTGLDPEVRRVIWDIINRSKEGRSIVLTTHSMEEAEVLCRNVGIMAKGLLRCIGSIFHLKDIYGKGFRLSLAGSPQCMPAARSYVEQFLPEGWQCIDNFANHASYEFRPTATTLSTLFEQLEKHKTDLGLDDWGISQTSLEEVFLRIVQDADANAEL